MSASRPCPRRSQLGALFATMGRWWRASSDAVVAAPQPSTVDGDVDLASPEIRSRSHGQPSSLGGFAGQWRECYQQQWWQPSVFMSTAPNSFRSSLAKRRMRHRLPQRLRHRIPARIDDPVAVATTAEPAAAAPTAPTGPPTATAGSGGSHAAVPSPVAKKSPTNAKTTARRRRKRP